MIEVVLPNCSVQQQINQTGGVTRSAQIHLPGTTQTRCVSLTLCVCVCVCVCMHARPTFVHACACVCAVCTVWRTHCCRRARSSLWERRMNGWAGGFGGIGRPNTMKSHFAFCLLCMTGDKARHKWGLTFHLAEGEEGSWHRGKATLWICGHTKRPGLGFWGQEECMGNSLWGGGGGGGGGRGGGVLVLWERQFVLKPFVLTKEHMLCKCNVQGLDKIM